MAALSGSEYLFSGDHQRRRKSNRCTVWAWGARRQKVERILSLLVLMLSGQPRFSASHALITLPSVKIAPKEGVGSEREWHTFCTLETLRLMYYCTWREPSPVMMRNVPIHLSCCRHDYEGSFFFHGVFFIKPSVTLQNYHYAVHKDTLKS